MPLQVEVSPKLLIFVWKNNLKHLEMQVQVLSTTQPDLPIGGGWMVLAMFFFSEFLRLHLLTIFTKWGFGSFRHVLFSHASYQWKRKSQPQKSFWHPCSREIEHDLGVFFLIFYFKCQSLLFDENLFQMGWNNQLYRRWLEADSGCLNRYEDDLNSSGQIASDWLTALDLGMKHGCPTYLLNCGSGEDTFARAEV